MPDEGEVMPREQITPSKTQKMLAGDASPNHGDGVLYDFLDPELNVRWMPEKSGHGHVQLSIHYDAGSLAQQVKDADGASMIHLYTPALSRSEVNKLIRTLKSARDSAYGRDE